VIHPLDTETATVGEKKKRRSNANSCVLHIQGQHHSALLPGDIGVKEEESLVERSQETLQADVVVIAHHGSQTSSSSQFVRQVRARHAIAQAGYLNRFAHPAPAVEQRWREASVRFWKQMCTVQSLRSLTRQAYMFTVSRRNVSVTGMSESESQKTSIFVPFCQSYDRYAG